MKKESKIPLNVICLKQITMIEHKKYKLLEQGLKAVTSGTINLLILKGDAGWGKSFITKQYLESKKANAKHINTYSTPLAFYKLLYENRNRNIIVMDDVQVEDRKIISILKGACNNLDKDRIVQWNSTSDVLEKHQLPSEFKLKANLIIILNEDLIGFKPILNRSVPLTFNFSFKDKLQILKSVQNNATIDDEVINYVEKNCSGATQNLSIRSCVNLSKLKTSGAVWQDFAEELFQTDPDIFLLQNLVAKSQSVRCAQIEWCKQTGHHRATFFRKKKLLGI